MDLHKIQEMFDKDSKIDETNINFEETRSPALLNKYLKLYNNFRLMLSKTESDMKLLRKQKWEYYSGKSEKPFELKVLRQDIPTYLESDEDMIKLQSKLDYLKVLGSSPSYSVTAFSTLSKVSSSSFFEPNLDHTFCLLI